MDHILEDIFQNTFLEDIFQNMEDGIFLPKKWKMEDIFQKWKIDITQHGLDDGTYVPKHTHILHTRYIDIIHHTCIHRRDARGASSSSPLAGGRRGPSR